MGRRRPVFAARECQWCSAPFTPNVNNQVYCGQSCKGKAQRKRVLPPPPSKCAWCGCELDHAHRNRRYRSKSCRGSASWRRRRPRPTSRSCGNCGADITDLSVRALYCGSSCKNAASDQRRAQRQPQRNRERYIRERERRLQYAKDNSDQESSRVRKRNRRSRKYGNGDYVALTRWEWDRAVNRSGGRCYYCGKAGDVLQIEHVVPLSRGGRHAPANIVPSCAECNFTKHTSLLSEWRYARGGDSHLIL